MIRRWTTPHPHKALLLIGLAMGLASCATDKAPPPPCPEILIPIDGAKLTRFQPGAGRDIIDVQHEELVSGFAHACEYNLDDTGAGNVVVQILPEFESKRGPANPDDQAQFEFFIAIVDQDKNLLEKKRFPASIVFPPNMSRVVWQRGEPIPLTIPLEAGQTGQNFQIFLGLQLTRDELEYERKIR